MKFECHDLLEKLDEEYRILIAAEPVGSKLLKACDLLLPRIISLISATKELDSEGRLSTLCKSIDACVLQAKAELSSNSGDEVLSLHEQIRIERLINIARQRARRELKRSISGGGMHSDEWSEWKPREYLDTFFENLGPDTYKTLHYLQSELGGETETVSRILDFGCGPAAVISLAVEPFAEEIHMADYLESNVHELNKWINAKEDAFNWDHVIGDILNIEGIPVTKSEVYLRAARLRKKAMTLLCDASLSYPLLEQQGAYPVVLSIFCPDSATNSKEIWNQYMDNIANLIDSQGRLIVAALRNCRAYRVGEKLFPSANINEKDLEQCLQKRFIKDSIKIESHQVPECESEGFSSLMFASAIKDH